MISIFLVEYMNRLLVLPTWPRLFLHLGCFCLVYQIVIYMTDPLHGCIFQVYKYVRIVVT